MQPRIFLGVHSLGLNMGGIARVARLTARVLGEESAAGRLQVRGISLLGEDADGVPGLPMGNARGSRLAFAARVQAEAFRSTHFVYDFMGMARAHCRIPLLRRPYLTWLCGIEVWEGIPPRRIALARRAALSLAISGYTLARAQRLHGPLPEARVCWLGTETDDPAPSRRAPHGPPTVLILSRLSSLERYKGHRELIGCWPRVAAAVPDARLVIAGSGDDREDLERLAAEATRGGGRIEFRGFVPEERIQDLWDEAHVFAMPSRGEGFGLVYIEAMRQGVPVIASVHDAGQEVNRDGVTGYNVDQDRPEDLAERLIQLLRNPDEGSRMGEAGRAIWQKEFSFGAFRRRFTPLLRAFLG